MKQKDLLKRLHDLADEHDLVFELVRHGANHDIYSFDGQTVSIPRHKEINELTAKGIIRTCEEEAEG